MYFKISPSALYALFSLKLSQERRKNSPKCFVKLLFFILPICPTIYPEKKSNAESQ